jgi:RNA polymerase sigma factor (TIGR02999 family)
MKADSPGDVTLLLIEWSKGDKEALNKLMPIIYDALRKIAYSIASQKGSPAQILQPTALIHEAYLRLIDQNRVAWRNREQFFAVAAREIRRTVIDEFRKSRSEKRGGDQFRISLANVENILAVQGAD